VTAFGLGVLAGAALFFGIMSMHARQAFIKAGRKDMDSFTSAASLVSFLIALGAAAVALGGLSHA
jgi:hypothetical protein